MSGEFPVAGLAAGQFFDVIDTGFLRVDATGGPFETVEMGNGTEAVPLSGNVGLAMAVVTVELDFEPVEGVVDVDATYEVMSDALGDWTLDTSDMSALVSGEFPDPAPTEMESFDVAASAVLAGGGLLLAGTVDLPESIVTVALDLDQDGIGGLDGLGTDVTYEVTSDENGDWSFNTGGEIPTAGVFLGQPAGQAFDVSATAAIPGSMANLELEGVVDLPGSFVTVTLIIDPLPDQEDPGPVEFEVVADGEGKWTLDTATAVPSSGTFTELEPGQGFFAVATPFASDTVIENEIDPGGGIGGGRDIDISLALDIDEAAIDATTGSPVITGTSALANTTINVGLDRVDDGDAGDDITLKAVGEVRLNEVLAGAGNDVVRLEVTGEPTVRPPDPDVAEFRGGATNNEVQGRSGDDRVDIVVDGENFEALDNTIRGGIGDDEMTVEVRGDSGNAERNFLFGEDGDDDLLVETKGSGAKASFNELDGGEGTNSMTIRVSDEAFSNTILGGAGNDTIRIESTGAPLIGVGGINSNTIDSDPGDGDAGNDDITLVTTGGDLIVTNTIMGGDG